MTNATCVKLDTVGRRKPRNSPIRHGFCALPYFGQI